MEKLDAKKSKLLSLVLRHQPELIGIDLDSAGWTPVAGLLDALARHGKAMTAEDLERVVTGNDKQRFAFSADRQMIRANQGHSVAIELGLSPAVPPVELFHGTAARFLDSIREQGLTKQQRHHVHLHRDASLAETVGARRGAAVVLTIDAAAMQADGKTFFVTENQVWLTEAVPPRYLRFPG
jgi:putative RNA 2'-phosphotransferase